ncbi:hypothetical protein F0235_06550 [Vibrio splendidus]|uniref:hypothetical protein n=1 Tax=Vibrio splendidus TaxID=29497 RepID=UPI00148DABBC|nr:hypothetical protein [Vibrio splendidus]NOI90096.1 hypothetical protein [Vibrio splendidus]
MPITTLKFPEHIWLRIMLFVMGAMIILFNVKGYEVLFHADPLIPFIPISPFGILLGCAEIAVLAWTSAVIREWSVSSRVLKVSMFALVPAFWFLCYSGVNSYLDSLATEEIRKVEEAKKLTSNNEEYLATLSQNVNKYERQLTELRAVQASVNEQISIKNIQIQQLSDQASARRLKALDCSAVPDCKSSVFAFESQSKRIANDVQNLDTTRNRNQERLSKLQDDLDSSQNEIDKRKLANTLSMNEFAGTESGFILKKSAYEKAVLSIFSLFGVYVEKPFDLFMMLVSGLIYPVYFLLNLFLSLNSEENRIAREKRLESKKVRHMLLQSITRYIRSRTLRKKKTSLENLADSFKLRRKRKSRRELVYKKMIRYFRVWAHRRKKTKTVKVEKIIEVPTEVEIEKIVEVENIVEKEIEVEKIIEIEKIVEKEVEVERIIEIEKIVEKEVAVEVEKIVEVPTEVPVYVEKIKTIPEPMFINDPQIIIHERIIPVPADITGKELEELINAQPRLNTVTRNSEREDSIPTDESDEPSQELNKVS